MRPNAVFPDPVIRVSQSFTFFNAKFCAAFKTISLACAAAATLSLALAVAPALSAQTQSDGGAYIQNDSGDQSAYASPDYHAPRDAYGNVVSPQSTYPSSSYSGDSYPGDSSSV